LTGIPVAESLAREIEEAMAARLGRPCLYFPSGRLALYAGLRASLAPGNRILMSPVTDDVILFVVLAAGLRPVMAEISPDDGNIDPDLVPDATWRSLSAVLTTNLYGFADRVRRLRAMCDKLGLVLVEDAAHAIETVVDGRPIGTFGEFAAFSLSKHVGAHGGGVLAFSHERDRAELEAIRTASVIEPTAVDSVARAVPQITEDAVIAGGFVWPARRLRRRLRLTERTANRMALRAPELRAALERSPDVAAFDPWLRMDRHDYRLRTSARVLRRALSAIHNLDDDRARRVEGVRRLRELGTVASRVLEGEPQPLFRVPLLVDDRPSVTALLERRLVGVGYIYDPPLDDYAGREFVEPSPRPETARSWARRVFPVDPREADAVLAAARACPLLAMPVGR
jgi:DegT/DnrJ/EryC1/StrS aminotransferase family